MRNAVSRPSKILVGFIESDLSLASSASTSLVQDRGGRKAAEASLAEKPKVEELQTDWLRSEDLKEEKNVTASIGIITGEHLLYFGASNTSTPTMNIYWDAVTPDMREAHGKIVGLALNGTEDQLNHGRWWAL